MSTEKPPYTKDDWRQIATVLNDLVEIGEVDLSGHHISAETALQVVDELSNVAESAREKVAIAIKIVTKPGGRVSSMELGEWLGALQDDPNDGDDVFRIAWALMQLEKVPIIDIDGENVH